MSLERELDRIDRRIQDARGAIETAYAARVPDERKDALYERLETLLWTRLLLRRRWSDVSAAGQMLGPMRRALTKLGRDALEMVRRFFSEFKRLEEARERSRPAFWRAYCPAGDTGVPGSLVDDRRPVWGYRRRMGRR